MNLHKLLIVALISATFLCSCKRQYMCYCDKLTPTGAEHYERELWEKSKDKAKTECEKQNGLYLWEVSVACHLK